MLPEMKTNVRWITNCLVIYCVICADKVIGAQKNDPALLLYSSDTAVDNLISIQLDSITLNKIIAESEALGKIVKKINFRDVNGFAKLVRGRSSKFSFIDEDSRESCDVSCSFACKEFLRPSIAQPKPFVLKKDTTTAGPPYLPPIINKKDEGIFAPSTTTRRTSRPTTTQRFKTTEKITQKINTIRPTVPSVTLTQTLVTSKQSLITSTQTPVTANQSSATPTQQLATTTRRLTTLSRSQLTTTLREKSSASTIAATQRSTQLRPRLSTLGPAYLPLAKKITPKRSTVTERSYPPATWPSTYSRTYTQTFPTWSAPIRRSTSFQTVVTTSSAKYFNKKPLSNALSYSE